MNSRASLAAAASVVAGLIALPTSATAAPGPGADALTAVVIHDVPLTTEIEQRILRYWTPDRMTRALPPLRPGARSRPQPARLPYRVAPQTVPFTSARRDTQQAAVSANSRGAVWPDQGRVRATTGKVFFTMGGRDYLCSAGTVTSANRDTVVTAGHCVKNGTGAWAENWIFVPGYRDGSGPAGGFVARRMFAGAQWSEHADDDYDVAMVALGTADGKHVTDAVGAQAIGFNRPRGNRVYGFGYPASGAYDGERLVYCSGRPHTDAHSRAHGLGLRCDMTQGSSGGPWLTDFDPATGAGTFTSVSSFKYADDSGTMYGPYFGDAVRSLYDKAQRG
ncbi:MAG TPA: trypsin-like peptidase domain-containing protein [Streptosporangiaceae bacterium]|jgi:V8-like Glu-specific endopeptidase